MITMPLQPRQKSDGVYTGKAGLKKTGARYENNRLSDMMSQGGVYLGGSVVPTRSPAEIDAIEESMRPEPLQYQGDQGRLFKSIQRSYRSLRGYREVLSKLVNDYAGTYYANDTTPGATSPNRYVNLLLQAVEAYQMLLVADRPQTMISTSLPQYRAFAKHFQHALNSLIKEIHLDETLEQWVMDAFFGIGIIKTHLADSGLVEIETDWWMDPGRPFASNVSLDNFVYDMQAKKWSEIRYAGDMYRLAWDDALELFGEDALRDHQPSPMTSSDPDRVENASRSSESDNDDLEDMIDLIDIWVPRHGVTYTYVVSSRQECVLSGTSPVAVEEWTGDEQGPYHILGFHDVPENIMPSSPAANLEMLDALVNDLMRKCSAQARGQKDLTFYTDGGAEAMRQVAMAGDGECIKVNDTTDISAYKTGGADPGNYAFMQGGLELFNMQAGNIQALMGLGPQASTVGQEQIIQGAASKKIEKMGKRVLGCTTKLVKALGQMLWDDPIKEIVSEIPIEGTTFSVTSVWEPGDREGNFIDYNLEIDVFSMQYQSPQSKLARVTEIVQMLVPLAPMLQQQGGMMDLFELVKLYSELMNLPELMQVVKFVGGTGDMMSQGPTAEVPLKPPSSTRNYVRTNVSAGQNQPLAQSAQMMGKVASGPQTTGGMT